MHLDVYVLLQLFELILNIIALSIFLLVISIFSVMRCLDRFLFRVTRSVQEIQQRSTQSMHEGDSRDIHVEMHNIGPDAGTSVSQDALPFSKNEQVEINVMAVDTDSSTELVPRRQTNSGGTVYFLAKPNTSETEMRSFKSFGLGASTGSGGNAVRKRSKPSLESLDKKSAPNLATKSKP